MDGESNAAAKTSIHRMLHHLEMQPIRSVGGLGGKPSSSGLAKLNYRPARGAVDVAPVWADGHEAPLPGTSKLAERSCPHESSEYSLAPVGGSPYIRSVSFVPMMLEFLHE